MPKSNSSKALIPPQVSPPEFAVTDAAPTRVVGASVVALPVLRSGDSFELGPGAAEAAEDIGADFFALLEPRDATPGEVVSVPLVGASPAPPNPMLTKVLLVGVGDGTPADVRRAGAAIARAARDEGSVASSVHCVGDHDVLAAFVEGAVLGSFNFTMRTTAPAHVPVDRIVLAQTPSESEPIVPMALALAGAGWRSRFLATVPSNVKSPQWMVEQAEGAAVSAGLKMRVWDETELEQQGFGGLVAVGRASATPPRLVQLDYTPVGSPRGTPHVVLVGKGITFDSGGLSIKPADAMATMKRDMTGAAVVLAVLEACRSLAVPVRVTGLLALAENAIGGAAMRPGDVITHYDGSTTEVYNTDAEGRLVLADALAYAAAELAPDVLVDVATLTGGMKVALGLDLGGMFATDDVVADALIRAGAAAGEPLWRMPLANEYVEKLSSKVAAQNNAPNSAPAITAALFLQPFTDGVPWAHLDIASIGDSPEDKHEWTAGPTGFGPRLLLRWLSSGPAEGVG